MDILRRGRAPVRALLTKTSNEIVAELAKDAPDKAATELKVKKANKYYQQLSEWDMKVLNGMIEDDTVTEQELVAEHEAIDKYDEEWIAIEAQVHKKFPLEQVYEIPRPPSPNPSVAGSVNGSVNGKKTYKMPKISLKKFNGDLKEWLGFWSQFEKIHEDEELHDADKFQYLVQSIVIGSKAREVVDMYPQTAKNYPKAIAALQERFGNPKLLKQVYVRELMKMIQLNSGQYCQKCSTTSNGSGELSTLYTKLESHLRSLDSLGVTMEMMATFLYPMVESSLSNETLVAWQRSHNYGKDGSKENPPRTEMDYLMEFLKQEVSAEDQRKLARGDSDMKKSQPKENRKRTNFQRETEDDIPTAAGLHTGQSSGCVFCQKSHPSQECFKAIAMTLPEKRNALYQKKLCTNCFCSGHFWKNCKSGVRCTGCSGRHYHIMCPSSNKPQKPKEAAEFIPADTIHNNSNQVKGGLILLKTLLVKIPAAGGDKTLRVLFDDGSQKSYVRKEVALKAGCDVIGSCWERNSLFGGVVTEPEKRTVFSVPVHSVDGKTRRNLPLSDKSRIAKGIPKITSGPWLKELKEKRIWVSDFQSDSEEIDILIGADLMPQLITGKSIKLKCGLLATQTVFGWTLMGPLPVNEMSTGLIITAMAVSEFCVPDLWKLEVLGIQDPAETKSKKETDLEVKQHFLETVTRGEDGRYCVRLPWIGGVQSIPSNKCIAEKRLLATTNKLNKDGRWKEYDAIFKQWEQEDFIEVIKEKDEEVSCHYLPHRPVYKPESLTTPVRPVFDASCKVGRNPSLNNCLEKGPNYIELIPSIMLRFREKRIGVVSDIRKAFPMVAVNEVDQNYLRFLWWEDESCKKMKIFRHKRVVFGVTCSPFLLGAVIQHHLSLVDDHDKGLAEKLFKSLYVDNCLISLDSHEEYESFKANATKIMQQARMELRQWECSAARESRIGSCPRFTLQECGLDCSSDVSPDLKNCTSVLGMKWDKRKDTLRCDAVPEMPEKLSKRTLLSTLQKIFDPMGFLSPAMIQPKRILQETWAQKLEWDEELPAEVKSRFIKWADELRCLEKIEVPRNSSEGGISRDKWQIHTFTDASQLAYAAVVFLRVEHEDGVTAQLLQSKARVAPLKNMTIPRLELMSCTIGSRLTKTVVDALELNIPIYYWSDSTTALSWIKRNDEWGTFVGNRVKEICQLTKAEDWRHVPGLLNPADLPSRGCTPEELLDSKWWEGPSWLKGPASEWPSHVHEVDEDAVTAEKKKCLKVEGMLKNITEEINPWYACRFSSYSSCVRVLAWIKRFVGKARRKTREFGHLTVKEVNAAELDLFRLVQEDVFPADTNVINGLRVTKTDSLYHVKTKLLNRQDTIEFKLPVLLPHSHPVTERLIREEHLNNGHAGVQFLISKLREKVWIVKTRKAVRNIVQSCPRCRRYKAKAPVLPVAPLPNNRVKNARVFEVTGVDLAGPLYLKNKSKVWIVLFTCAVYRGVHLELVESLNTDSFLLALFRFISRRGRPSIIYSDNGTNFVGAFNLFKELNWQKIQKVTGAQRIQWIFNPPSAAWWGGFWERLIQTVKDLLRKMLGFGKLNYMQLLTCLSEVEAVVNARPLTYVTEDQDDLIPLTPAMFMQDVVSSDCPEAEVLGADRLRKAYKDYLTLKEELRQRFRSEYLGLLTIKGKDIKTRAFKIGDVVLIASDNRKKISWPMAKILLLKPGTDGVVRVAVLKTNHGELVRPLQRLIPLEVDETDEPSLPITHEVREKVKIEKKKIIAEPEVITRLGRKVKKPERLGAY